MSKKSQNSVSSKTKMTVVARPLTKKPTKEELKKVTKETLSQYREAIRNLAKR